MFNKLFGFTDEVDRKFYLLSGLTLMLLKYLGESLSLWFATRTILSPIHFLLPIISIRLIDAPAASWYFVFLLLWTLPFLWIAVSMSVRRAIDAGLSPWFGLGVLVPLLNYVVMFYLAAAPTKRIVREHQMESRVLSNQAQHSMIGILSGVAFGIITATVATYLASQGLAGYSSILFLGVPTVMGTVSSYIYHRGPSPNPGGGLKLSLVTVLAGGLIILLFALEGFICLLMALPIALLGGILGGLIGATIAAQKPSHSASMHAFGGLVYLAVSLSVSELLPIRDSRLVLSAVTINAPIEVVWPRVVEFPDLEAPREVLFQLGIAYPVRARIEGVGPGAIRYCEFSTGAFVEPITHWQEPYRLAFDVTKQPPAMRETSLWRSISPSHLLEIPKSRHGEFRLRRVSETTTILEGRTWYDLDIAPGLYWGIWSDWIIGSIHSRVLNHIKTLAENEAAEFGHKD